MSHHDSHPSDPHHSYDRTTANDRIPEEPLSRALGWFSLGLGAAQLAAPRGLSSLIGVPPKDEAIAAHRAVGLREVASGAGILTQANPTNWVRGRIAGDLLDLALLGAALGTRRANRGRILAAAGAVAGVAALDVLAARRLAGHENGSGTFEAVRAITIRKEPIELYHYWRELPRLPEFMWYLDEIEVLDERRSRWKASAPIGSVQWTASITEDRPGEVIAWESEPDSALENSGRVTFRPAPRDRGTEVKVYLRYAAPAGSIGAGIARLLGQEPGQQMGDSLRRLKQIMETGEVVRSESSPWGVDRRRQRMQKPGQPPSASVASSSAPEAMAGGRTY